MSNYQTRFDELTTEARRLVVNKGGEIRAIIPGFYGQDFDRLTKSISKLLEKVDKGSVDHPEYLAHSSGNIAEYAIQVLQGVPSSLESGASHFVQTTLPTILACEEKLLKAVGHYFFQVRDIKDRQVREIQKLAEESVGYRETARKSSVIAKELGESIEGISKTAEALKTQSSDDAQKIAETRELAEKLASGDGRGKSLEAFRRIAEGKIESIDTVLNKASTSSTKADASLKRLEEVAGKFDETRSDLDSIKAQAEAVLSLSNQAGLASSYLKESQKLAFKSTVFTGILYLTSIATALIAAFYVLPSLEHTITSNGGNLSDRALPVTLLRATILAPLVYVIYFTTRQISSLETLRMDYAEKAAASLAYSGYKEEMSEDTSLLDRLRGSLLLKFAEHPERLLRRRPVRDTIEVETPGFKATSSSAEVPLAADSAGQSA